MLFGTDVPAYIDTTAASLLEDARSECRRLDFVREPICQIGEGSYLVATWTGTVKTSSLALVLRAMGYTAETHDGFLNVYRGEGDQPVEAAIEEIARMPSAFVDNVLSGGENLMTEKFHPYLNAGLLLEDALSSRLNLVALPKLARSMLESSERQGRPHGR